MSVCFQMYLLFSKNTLDSNSSQYGTYMFDSMVNRASIQVINDSISSDVDHFHARVHVLSMRTLPVIFCKRITCNKLQ